MLTHCEAYNVRQRTLSIQDIHRTTVFGAGTVCVIEPVAPVFQRFDGKATVIVIASNRIEEGSGEAARLTPPFSHRA